MTHPKKHYEQLLAEHYTWMFGVPFDEKVREQKELLIKLGIAQPGVAVDLGCGSGFQSIALVELGATCVHAIDTSIKLLSELSEHAGDKPVVIHELDLQRFGEVLDTKAETITCMGDTLTHLSNKDDVTTLFNSVSENLREDGQFVVSWRDLSTPAQELDRFIPLRMEDDRLMTCFLEDLGKTVLVHDLVHIRDSDGWRFERSAYPKLKLSSAWIESQLSEAKLSVVSKETIRGMIIIGAKPLA